MAHPVSVSGFDHIVLRIRDKARMIGFYRDVLGLAVDRDRAELGLTHMRAGSELIDLVTIDGPLGRKGGAAPGADARNLDHFCLRLRPFDEMAIREHLAAYDVEVEEAGERYGADGNGMSLYIRDPEGNVIELKGPSS